jgi:DNA-3-methyladenine glycosylase II
MKRNVIPPYASDAVAHLKRVDPILGDVIDRVGSYAIARRPERFHSLVRAIIFQQLAGRAAQTIFDRFVKAVGGKRFPTPALLLAASDEVLRSAGLSRGKMSYIRDLATHVNNRTLNFHRHSRMTDDEIIADLTRVRGIGRWTAEMFLMFNLHRPDVLPVDDLGVRNAVGRLYAMSPTPTAKALREFGERWRPYRSVASWYLWRSYDIIITPESSIAATDDVAKKRRAKESATSAQRAIQRNDRAAKKAIAKPPTPKPLPRKAGVGKTNARKSISIKTGAAKITRAAPAKSTAARKTRAQTAKKS